MTDTSYFKALVLGFGGQVAGRLVDLRWHATHEEFEGAAQQLEAHWLIWVATVVVVAVAAGAVRQVADEGKRRGYRVVLVANLAYAVIAVIHFFQHLDHLEVDWTHLLLAVTNAAGVIGVLWLVALQLRSSRKPGAVR